MANHQKKKKKSIITSAFLRYSMTGFANYNYLEIPKSKWKNDKANFSPFNYIRSVHQEPFPPYPLFLLD